MYMRKDARSVMDAVIRNAKMVIYTKTGDSGTTSLYGGKRVSKFDIRVESYGSLDELNSFLGLLVAKNKNNIDKKLLTEIQKNLYLIMSALSGSKNNLHSLGKEVEKLEKEIDFIQSKLPQLNAFILPQGVEVSCLFHIARTVCRRSERRVVECFQKWKIENHGLIITYLNRLSDLLFVMARKYNNQEITI